MIRATPIEASDLPEVGGFLNAHLNKKISPEDWIAALSHRWAETLPNHGMQLRDNGRLVGIFCAIYSDQWIDGKLERFCNPHSWCVLNEYRNQSIGLILPLLKQPGYHFTMYTPNPKVAEIFRGLKFRDLDNGQVFFPNLPSIKSCGGDFLEHEQARISARLAGHLLRDFNEHRSIRWLKFIAFGNASDTVLLIYKRETAKRLPCARIIHLSDPMGLERHGHLVKNYYFWKCGIPISRIESRFISRAPWLSIQHARAQPKLVLTKTLSDGKCTDLYSELAALDV